MKKGRHQTDQTGRTASGRFTVGNAGGPGNPFARRIASLRSTMLAAITTEDIEAIVKSLIATAKTGEISAIKLLLSYAIGQPDKQVDPDSLDGDEYEKSRKKPSQYELALLSDRFRYDSV